MNWKSSLITAMGAGSVLIRLGIMLGLWAICGFFAVLTAAAYSTKPAQNGDNYGPIGATFLCLPLLAFVGLTALIATVWALSGARQYLIDSQG